VLRAAAIAERAGVPSVSIVTTPFREQAAVVAKGVGMPALPIAEYPGVPMTDGPETVRAKVERLIDAIVDGLARPVETALTRPVEPAARDVVFRGTLDEVQEFFVIDHIGLIEEHDDSRHPDLARQENMLPGLRHRSVGRRYDENRAVHLSGSGDHVLDVVGVTGTIDMGIVALVRLILDVRDINGQASLSFLRSFIDLIISKELRLTLFFQDLGNGSSQGRFPVVDVTDSADVQMRFFSLKLLFAHLVLL